jgi:quinol monooxygenase YgiN
MFIERAEFPVKEGMEDEFAEAMRTRGIALLSAAEGCHSVEVGRGVENPGKFILLLKWESVEAHIALTKTQAFDTFKALVAPYFAGASNMEHFALI